MQMSELNLEYPVPYISLYLKLSDVNPIEKLVGKQMSLCHFAKNLCLGLCHLSVRDSITVSNVLLHNIEK